MGPGAVARVRYGLSMKAVVGSGLSTFEGDYQVQGLYSQVKDDPLGLACTGS